MKVKHLLILLAAGITACNTSPSKKIKLNSDSLKYEPVEAKRLIVPGESIGRFRLGQKMTEVDSILGKPDSGDAAMGKAWGVWYGKNSTNGKRNEIAIYSAYADSNMNAKAVKQIRVISGKFATFEGNNNGQLFSDFEMKYPDFTKVATYVDTKLGDTIVVYDSKASGIAVEFLRDISRAITIHTKGQSVDQSYFTLNSNWKQL